MEQKHGHWQADWWMFYMQTDVIAIFWGTWKERGGKTGGLAGEVAQMCGVEDISSKLRREDQDGLDIWKGQRGVC